MTGEPAIRSGAAYRCPHCQAALEDRTGRATEWLRCPNCGRPGRAPEGGRLSPREVASPRDDLFFIDDLPVTRSMTPVGGAWPLNLSGSANRPGSAARVVYAAALFVSLTLLLFMAWEKNSYGVTVSISAAIVSLGLLVRSARW